MNKFYCADMKILFIFCFVFFLIASCSVLSFSQDTISFLTKTSADEVEKNYFNKKKFITAVCVQAGAGTGSIAALSSTWYKNYPHTTFHFFDDSREWLMMDKAGHIFTSYYLGRVGCDMFLWSGTGKKYSAWMGAGVGFLYLSAI